jgi:hypothetical protein
MARAQRKPSQPIAKPVPKLRGNRQPILILLPPELVTRIEVRAKLDGRSRSAMIVRLLEHAVTALERRHGNRKQEAA